MERVSSVAARLAIKPPLPAAAASPSPFLISQPTIRRPSPRSRSVDRASPAAARHGLPAAARCDHHQRRRAQGRRRGGVEAGSRSEGRHRGTGPLLQGGGRLHAAAVPARPGPPHRQGVGDASQVPQVEADGEAARFHLAGGGGARALPGEALPAGLRQAGPPHDLRLRRQAPPVEPRPRRVQALRRPRPRRHRRQAATDPRRAGEVRRRRRPQGLGLLQLRHPGLPRRAGDHAELLPGAAGARVPRPRALRLHGRVEDRLPFHRRQHQEEVRVRVRQGPRQDAPGGHRRRTSAGDLWRQAQARLAAVAGQMMHDHRIYRSNDACDQSML